MQTCFPNDRRHSCRVPGNGPRTGALLRAAITLLFTGAASIDVHAQVSEGAATPMGEDSASPLSEVRVIGSTPLPGLNVDRAALPSPVQSANSRQIRDEGGLTVADYMNRRFGGVYINEAQSNPFQPDVQYRGFTASPLLGNPIGLSVFVDGVRMNESFGDVVMWDQIPTIAIDSMNLISGANPVYGLNTLGGALSMQTKSGRRSPGPEVNTGFGSFGRRELSAAYGLAGENVDGFISAEYLRDGGWRDHSRSTVRRLFGKIGWEDTRNRISLSWSHADNELTGNGMLPDSIRALNRRAVYTYPDISTPTTNFFNLSGSRQLDGDWMLSANAYYRELKMGTLNGDADYDDGDGVYEATFRSTQLRQKTQGIGVQLARDGQWGGMRHRFAVGAGLDSGTARFRDAGQTAVFTADRGVVPTAEADVGTDVRGRNRYLSLYVTDTVSVTPTVDVTASARYTRARVELNDVSGKDPLLDGAHSFSRVSPSIGATWKATQGLSVYGSYGEGFRVPTPVEFACSDPANPCLLPVAFIADPPLAPVVAKTLEAGVRGSRGAIRWNAGVFQTKVKNDILFTSVGFGRGFFANVPGTKRQGLELGAGSRQGALDWSLQYTWMRATYDADVQLFNPLANANDPSQPSAIDVKKGNRIPGLPEHMLKAGVDWHVDDRLTVGATANLIGAQYFRTDESNQRDQLKGYALFNLRAGYRVTPAWTVFGRVDNLFDSDYSTLGTYHRNAFPAGQQASSLGAVEAFRSPGTPRTFWLGVSWRPDAKGG